MSRWKMGLVIVSTFLVGLLIFGLLLFLVPVNLQVSEYKPNPAENFEESLARFEDLASRDGEEINPVCRSRLHHQNQKTDKVIVLFHGMYNCPKQHDVFAQRFVDQGYNVLIPRIPYNGYQDAYTSALKYMTPKVLIELTREIVDMAAGLGDEVVFFGLSTSGNMLAWAVQETDLIDRAVILSPFMAIKNVPVWSNDFIGNFAYRLGNIPMQHFMPFGGGRDGEMDYAYKGHSTKAIGYNLVLARAVLDQAEDGAVPKANKVVVITNAADEAVENEPAKRLVELWQTNGYENMELYEFPAELGLIHDTMDPRQPAQRVDIVYPLVEDYLL
jgi:carboxylesterase